MLWPLRIGLQLSAAERQKPMCFTACKVNVEMAHAIDVDDGRYSASSICLASRLKHQLRLANCAHKRTQPCGKCSATMWDL